MLQMSDMLLLLLLLQAGEAGVDHADIAAAEAAVKEMQAEMPGKIVAILSIEGFQGKENKSLRNMSWKTCMHMRRVVSSVL
jgi:hypothetical protein